MSLNINSIVSGSIPGLPKSPIDPTFVVEMMIPAFRDQMHSILDVAIRAASLLFAQKVAAPVAVLVPAGLPKELHGRIHIDLIIGGIVNKIVEGAGAIFRMALLPQRRAELLHEIHTPTLDKAALAILIQNEMRKRAGIYILTPLRDLLDKQGKYGKFIGTAVSKVLNPDILSKAVTKVILGLPV